MYSNEEYNIPRMLFYPPWTRVNVSIGDVAILIGLNLIQ